MKTNPWLILGVLLSTGLMAQQQPAPPADTTPAAPPPAAAAPAVEPAPAPPAETAPAATPVKKKKKRARHVAKRELEEPFVALVAGPAVVSGKNVNVRARPKLSSEVITKLNTGDAVTVIEQINLEKTEPDEPKQWAKIAYPSSADVWVRASFVDANSMLVSVKKLNLRSGPGENYNVVGTLDSGSPVKQVKTQGDWMKIEAPNDSYAFIAAQYLRQETGFQPNAATAAAIAGTNETPATPELAMNATPPPMESTPPAAAPATPPAEETPGSAPSATPTPAPSTPAEVIASAPPQPPTPAPATPEVEQPLPPRIVSHEGVVKPTVSIQAPTDFGLESLETGKLEDFLYTTTTNLDISKYNGLHIVVTGEESVDERWTNTPVITISRIQVVQ